MGGDHAGARMKDYRDDYEALVGALPRNVERRIALARATGRESAIEAIEAMRTELLLRNPLDRRIQQLVHMGMLVALGEDGPAALHAHGALKAGATLADLQGLAETAAIVCGMPGYSRAVAIIDSLGLVTTR